MSPTIKRASSITHVSSFSQTPRAFPVSVVSLRVAWEGGGGGEEERKGL